MTDAEWYAEGRATLGDRLQAAREAAGLTLAEGATRIGVRAPTLRGWENDAAEPRANRLQMLAAFYGVSLRWLMTGEGPGLRAPAGCPADEATEGLVAGLETALADLRQMRGELVHVQDRLGRIESLLARLRHGGMTQ
jgi:HTH-type transcriptional regulator, cell division transcriptional repressor